MWQNHGKQGNTPDLVSRPQGRKFSTFEKREPAARNGPHSRRTLRGDRKWEEGKALALGHKFYMEGTDRLSVSNNSLP